MTVFRRKKKTPCNAAFLVRHIEKMLDAIQQGVLTSSTKQRLGQLEESKNTLEVQILQEELQRPRLTEEQIAF